MKIIAYLETDLSSKFAVPRQSGLVPDLSGTIVFEPPYRNPDALQGLESFSHLWLLWQFSLNPENEDFHATVRPPRFGGNVRLGVFATRSPFRPNRIGLSCVEIRSIELRTDRGPLIHVKGADLVDHTPIIDIKPYIPYADCHPEARTGFAPAPDPSLRVILPEKLSRILTEEQTKALVALLSLDPRPAYQKDPERIYGFPYAGYEVRFRVEEDVLIVLSILPEKEREE